MVTNFYMYMRRNFFIFGRGPCGIVVLRGPGSNKGLNRLIINGLGFIKKF